MPKMRWAMSFGFVANFLRFPAVQKFWKSVKIRQSYIQLKWELFLRHSVWILLRKIARHLTGPSRLTHHTSSPSGEVNWSRLWWWIPLEWMTPLSSNQDSICLDATRHCWITSGPSKATADPDERSGALQQLTCALVANAKRCHIVNSCPQSKLEGAALEGAAAATALCWWRC